VDTSEEEQFNSMPGGLSDWIKANSEHGDAKQASVDAMFTDALRWLARGHLRPLALPYKTQIGGVDFTVDPTKGG
jgi:hypothetical protein